MLIQTAVASAYGLRELLSGARDLWPAESNADFAGVPARTVMDLKLYAMHRASHAYALLWNLHAIHDSPERCTG